MIRTGICLLAALSCGGCFRLEIWHTWVEEPVADASIAALAPGVTDLARALEALGAPHFAWEYRGDGMALAWGWRDQWAPGFTISYNFVRYAPTARFTMEWDSRDWWGVVLFFGPDLVLERAERGWLSEIATGGRTRPAALDAGQE